MGSAVSIRSMSVLKCLCPVGDVAPIARGLDAYRADGAEGRILAV